MGLVLWWCELRVALFVLDLVVVVGDDFGVGVVGVGGGGDQAVVVDGPGRLFGFACHCDLQEVGMIGVVGVALSLS